LRSGSEIDSEAVIRLGHEIVEATLPFDKEQWLLAFMTILAGETQSDIRSASALAGRPLGFKDFEPSTYIAGLLGSAWSAADYASAAKHLQAWSRRVGDVFTQYDMLLTPTLAEPPPLIGALKPSSAELAPSVPMMMRQRPAGSLPLRA
jgi:amidase